MQNRLGPTRLSECSIKAKSGIQFRWNEAQETILPAATASAKNLPWPRNRAVYWLLTGLGKGISAEKEDLSIRVPLHSSSRSVVRIIPIKLLAWIFIISFCCASYATRTRSFKQRLSNKCLIIHDNTSLEIPAFDCACQQGVWLLQRILVDFRCGGTCRMPSGIFAKGIAEKRSHANAGIRY